MRVHDLRDLFEFKLMEVYDAEIRLTDAMYRISRDTTDLRVREAVDEHIHVTEGQIDRLRKVFDIINAGPSAGDGSRVAMALVADRDVFLRTRPEEDVLLMYDLGAWAQAEHYEIAAYTELIGLADRLGLDNAKSLLGESLAEEQKTLERVVTLAGSGDLLVGGSRGRAAEHGTTVPH